MKKILLFPLFLLACSASKKIEKMTFEEVEKLHARNRDSYSASFNDVIEVALKNSDCSSVEKYTREAFQAGEAFRDFWRSGGWNYGNIIFEGNMALGYCSLQKNDIENAKAYLLKASNSPGSPQLGSFGLPYTDMRLATELLNRGEKEIVKTFLNNCKKFWTIKTEYSDGNKKIESWIKDIDSGLIPSFKDI